MQEFDFTKYPGQKPIGQLARNIAIIRDLEIGMYLAVEAERLKRGMI